MQKIPKRAYTAELEEQALKRLREGKGACGSAQMVRELRARGFPANKARVERLMRAPPL